MRKEEHYPATVITYIVYFRFVHSNRIIFVILLCLILQTVACDFGEKILFAYLTLAFFLYYSVRFNLKNYMLMALFDYLHIA